jgi:hypothetical protein
VIWTAALIFEVREKGAWFQLCPKSQFRPPANTGSNFLIQVILDSREISYIIYSKLSDERPHTPVHFLWTAIVQKQHIFLLKILQSSSIIREATNLLFLYFYVEGAQSHGRSKSGTTQYETI